VRRVADHLARVPARRVVVDRHALALPGERAHQRLPADAAVRSHGAQQPCHELRHRRRVLLERIPEYWWICWPELHVPVLDRLGDEYHALRSVQLRQPAVVVAVALEAVASDRHGVLAVEWQAEEPHGAVLHPLHRSLVDSMACELQQKPMQTN